MREETRTDLYATAAASREYDEACKRIFWNKEIIAPIMQKEGALLCGARTERTVRGTDRDDGLFGVGKGLFNLDL